VLGNLLAHGLHGVVGGLFEGMALLTGEQVSARRAHLDFGNLVPFVVVFVDAQKHLALNDRFVEVGELVDFLLVYGLHRNGWIELLVS